MNDQKALPGSAAMRTVGLIAVSFLVASWFVLAPSHAATGTAWRGRCLSMYRGTDEDVVYAAERSGLAEACARITEHPLVYQEVEIPCGLGLPGCQCVGHVLRAAGGVTAQFDLGATLTLCDGSKFTLQADGNLVLYRANGTAIWATWTYGQAVKFLAMQADGNLVLYGANDAVVWATGTSGHPGAFLAVQEDGNLVVYDPGWHVLWNSGTAGN